MKFPEKKLKIAIFHLGFFFSGGGEKLVLEEARGLKRKGHDVDIFAPVVDSRRCFPDLLKKISIKKLFLPLPFYFPLRDFIAITASIVVVPLTFWRYSKYDVFLGANQPGPLICFILSKILGKPYIIYLAQPTRIIYPRDVDREVGFGKGSFDLFYTITKIFYPIVKQIDELSIKNASKILANGDYISGILEKTYSVKVVSCPAGCYPEDKSFPQINRFRGKLVVGKRKIEKPYILLTNRHFPQKKFDYIISSLPFILKKILNVRLVITGGETFYTFYLKALAGQLGIESYVYFLGLVSEAKLAELYKNAAVYVYTAPQEDFGMGVIEAMAAGTPVVAWRSGGPSTTVVHGKIGFLAKPFDLADFTKKVIMLLKDRKLNRKFGKQAKKRSWDFSYQRHIASLEKVLLEVVRTT